MNFKDFENLKQRVSRAKDAVAKKDADGFTQALNVHPGETVTVQGIKSPEQLEDEILTLCIWIWSMKDYLKTLAIANGGSGQQIESIVNNNDSLAIVADIANRAKHGTLTHSRTADFAKLSGVGYSIGQAALNSIAFGESGVTLDVGKPEDAEFNAKVEFESGNRDAISVIADALTAWETEAYPLIGA